MPRMPIGVSAVYERHSENNSSALCANAPILATRSALPVWIMSPRSVGPATAMQLVPGGSPYRLLVGPAAPISEIAHVVAKRCCAPRAITNANCSVSPRNPAKSSASNFSRVENWRAHGRWRVSSHPLSIRWWVHNSTMATFPAPASSNRACGFPALCFPARFIARVMRPIASAVLSA